MTLEIPDWVINEVNNRLQRGLENSRCIKRPIASVLWSHFGFFVNGSNGPPPCFQEYCTPCPRADSGSGENMDICPAVHGETDAVVRAAWDGVSTMDGVLFISCALPCKDCMKEIIRSGIKYIVSPFPLEYVERPDGFQSEAKHYNFPLSRQMMETCGVEYIHEPRLVKGR